MYCEQIQLSTCLQLYHLAVAIVPPVVRVPQFEKDCSAVLNQPGKLIKKEIPKMKKIKDQDEITQSW